MLLMKDLVYEGTESLRETSQDVKLPLSDQDRNSLIEMLGYLINSQDPVKSKELGLRAGVGLAAPQVGINKKMFAILTDDLEGNLVVLLVINPKIIKHSKEMTFIPGGEGCLSVTRETCGVTPRYRSIDVDCYLLNLKTNKAEHKHLHLKDYVAIVFQHEYDHLFGTLYVDKLLSIEEANAKGYKPLWDEEEA